MALSNSTCLRRADSPCFLKVGKEQLSRFGRPVVSGMWVLGVSISSKKKRASVTGVTEALFLRGDHQAALRSTCVKGPDFVPTAPLGRARRKRREEKEEDDDDEDEQESERPRVRLLDTGVDS